MPLGDELSLGFGCDKVTMVAVDRGMPWEWDLIVLEGHNDGGIVPFFVDWGCWETLPMPPE
jgi:hypothetical protein